MALQLPIYQEGTAPESFGLTNDNVFINTTFQELLGEKVLFKGGLSYTYNQDLTRITAGELVDQFQASQAKAVFSRSWSPNFTLRAGMTTIQQTYSQTFTPIDSSAAIYEVEAPDVLTAVFVEGQWRMGKKWAFRGGLRGEYGQLVNAANVAPRFSMAYQTSTYGQVSMAVGKYYQQPEAQWLAIQKNLEFEHADHYILNYQWDKDRRLFRVEGYHKQYHQLTRFASGIPYDPQSFSSDGNGYARGIEVFWRDRKSIKYGDYWVSYSFLDTERIYQNFPQSAVPSFASRHNLSVVGKYFLNRQNIQLGLTYRYASPRPYFNPNEDVFHGDQTPAYHDISANMTYLFDLWGNFTILHVACSNLLGNEQIFGYRYSEIPDATGSFPGVAVRPPARRFLFIGLFISIN